LPRGDSFEYLPEGIQLDIARLLLEKNPQKAAPELIRMLPFLSEGIREEVASLVFEKVPQKEVSKLVEVLVYMPEEFREDIARLALEKAPQKIAPKLMTSLRYMPEGIREGIARLALEKAPQEAVFRLMNSLEHLPKVIREDIARLALEKAPQEAVSGLREILSYVPEEIREDIARLALKKAPQEAAPKLMESLKYLPEEIREDIARLALERGPQETALELMMNLEYLREEIREDIAHLVFEKVPQVSQEAIFEFMMSWRFEDIEGVSEEVKTQFMEIIQTTERNRLIESESINPILYKEINGMEEQFSRKEFPKTGTRTVLLGGTLINNAILRIIPSHAFIAWMKAYSAVEDWKKAGFDYVPIEPILKASLCKDDENVRVYAGVLGISVEKYLKMYFNREHHQNVMQQVLDIKEVLEKVGIGHGHEHYGNFCVLHNRTPKGEIDWNTPPRIYCIDFDQSNSK
jgi:hypothetical protein